LLGIASFSGAAPLNAQVKTDCDHSANFSSYKTYSWLKVQRRGTDSADLSSNTNKNIQKLSKDIDYMFKKFPPK
jgi:hypothetical protein